jgi:hypothetical protein
MHCKQHNLPFHMVIMTPRATIAFPFSLIMPTILEEAPQLSRRTLGNYPLSTHLNPIEMIDGHHRTLLSHRTCPLATFARRQRLILPLMPLTALAGATTITTNHPPRTPFQFSLSAILPLPPLFLAPGQTRHMGEAVHVDLRRRTVRHRFPPRHPRSQLSKRSENARMLPSSKY